MINSQTDICINLSHAKSDLLRARALLKEIIISNIEVTDEGNLKDLENLDKINDEIKNKIYTLSGKDKVNKVVGIKKFDRTEEINHKE